LIVETSMQTTKRQQQQRARKFEHRIKQNIDALMKLF